MRRIFFVIPISAAVIAGLVVYRMNRTEPLLPVASTAGTARPAPAFQLYDEESRLVRLDTFRGRHKMLIVFFDGRQGPDRNELLLELRRKFLPIHESRALVLAISALRPSELRPPVNERGERTRREEPFPFTMLSDINDFEVHRRYGAFDESAGEPREAVFVIDRTGIIRHAHIGPNDLGTPELWAEELQRVR